MSFFDKLKNSMGIEEESEEEIGEEEKPKKAAPKIKEEKKEVKKIHVKSEDSPKEETKPKSKEEKQEWFEPEGELAVDVYLTERDVVIQATIAGVKPEHLDIAIENDVVTITGERENPNQDEERNYYTQECYWGPFSRQVILPEEVDVNTVDAMIKDGIFTLRLPKLDKQKVRKIKVKG